MELSHKICQLDPICHIVSYFSNIKRKIACNSYQENNKTVVTVAYTCDRKNSLCSNDTVPTSMFQINQAVIFCNVNVSTYVPIKKLIMGKLWVQNDCYSVYKYISTDHSLLKKLSHGPNNFYHNRLTTATLPVIVISLTLNHRWLFLRRKKKQQKGSDNNRASIEAHEYIL